MKHISRLSVYCAAKLAGTLALGDRGSLWFRYDPAWIAHGFNLHPQILKLDVAAQSGRRTPFSGLHGVFNDSLPDGWGLLLMNREFQKQFNWHAREIAPLDRLAYIGKRAMGALEYQPEMESDSFNEPIAIGELAKSAYALLDGKAIDVIKQLRIQGGSPGGARAKITLACSNDMCHCIAGFDSIPGSYAHWLVKFSAKGDPADMANIEMAYAEMAKASGIYMPMTRYINADNDGKFFAVQRFDREGNAKKHVLTLSGFLHADHREPCLDYESVLQATQYLTKSAAEVERAFRLMVFNIAAHNKDDHAKNFSFIFDEQWRLSPAYDLTFSAGMGNEHITSVNGSGNPTLKDIVELGRRFSIDWKPIVEQVFDAVSRWPVFAGNNGVSQASLIEIEKPVSVIRKRVVR